MKRVLIIAFCSALLASAYEPHGYSFEVPYKTWEDCEIADIIHEKISQTKIQTDASWEYLKTIIEPNYELLKQIGPLIITIEENELEIAKSYEKAVLLQTSTSSQAIQLLSGVQETSDFEIDSAYKVLQTAMTELKSAYTYEERAGLIEEIKSNLDSLLTRHKEKIEEVKEEVKGNYTVKLPALKKELDIAISLCASDELYQGEFDMYAPFVSTFEIYSTHEVNTVITEIVLKRTPAQISMNEQIGFLLAAGPECTLSFSIDIPNEYQSAEYAAYIMISGIRINIGYNSFIVEGYTPEDQLEIASQKGFFHVFISEDGKLGVLYNGQYRQYAPTQKGFDGMFVIKPHGPLPMVVTQILFKYKFIDVAHGKKGQDCEVKFTKWTKAPVECGIGETTRSVERVIRQPYGNGKPCPSSETKLYQNPVCPLSLPGYYNFQEIKKAIEVDTSEPYLKEGIYTSSYIKIYFASEMELRAATLEFTFKESSYDPLTNSVVPNSETSRSFTFSVVNREKEYHKDEITGLSNVVSIKVPSLVITDITLKTTSMEPYCSSNCLNFFKNNGKCEAACYNLGCGYDGSDCEVPKCSEKCSLTMVNDGVCHDECITPECDYDGQDCKCKRTGCDTKLLSNGQCDDACNNPECAYDAKDCLCVNTGCNPLDLGNGKCDGSCNNIQCRFDNSDCTCVEKGCPDGWFNDGKCQPECQIEECGFDNPDCAEYCDVGCLKQYINDKVCQEECRKSEKCQFDGTDCIVEPNCADGCTKAMRGNGVCNIECMVESCNYDDKDCLSCQLDGCPPGWDLDDKCDQICNIPSCSYDHGVCQNCSPTCTPAKLTNNVCDFDCFTEECGYDKKDCGEMCSYGCSESMLVNSICDAACQTEECDYDWKDCKLCNKGCRNELLGDKNCDEACNNKSCGFDLGDCPVEECSPGCSDLNKGNGICDKECFNESCGWDEVDCEEYCGIGCKKDMLGDGICQRECLTKACEYDSIDCDEHKCNSGCYKAWLGNKECDKECNTLSCEYDKGACLNPGECAPGCTSDMINNGKCDPECKNYLCQADGLDCLQPCAVGCTVAMQYDNKCQEACNVPACAYDDHKCTPTNNCAPGCLPSMVGDGKCDKRCFNEACSNDGGDCASCDCPIDFLGDGECDKQCNNAYCMYDKGDCKKSS